MRRTSRALVVAACAATASSQTYVVDRAGGGSFLQIWAAVAAVPSGATLRVRPGFYEAFSVANKSLKILGDTGTFIQVEQANQVAIGPIAAGDSILISGLWFVGGTQTKIPGHLAIVNAAGPVVLEGVNIGRSSNFPSPQDQRITVQDSANVRFVGCQMLSDEWSSNPRLRLLRSSVELAQCQILGAPGFDAIAFGTIIPATSAPAVVAISGGNVLLVDTSINGGRGGNNFFGNYVTAPAGAGGAAVTATSATVHVYGVATAIVGGNGGSSDVRPGGNGGAGLSLVGTAAVVGGVIMNGGSAGTGNPGGTAGAGIAADAASTVRNLTPAGPSLRLVGAPKPGNAVSLDLRSSNGDSAALLIGLQPLFAPSPFWLTLGTLGTLPLVDLSGFVVSSTGLLSIPLQLPTTLPLDQMFLLQCAVLPTGLVEIWMSNTVALVTRS